MDKLPPITNGICDSVDSIGMDEPDSANHDAVDITASPFKIPSRSQLYRRSSTFKATLLGYKPYPFREERNKNQLSLPLLEDMSNLRLESAGQESTEVSFTEDLDLGSATVENQIGEDSSLPVDQNEEQSVGGLTEEKEDQKMLFNQVERFERLMKVLDLLKGTANMDAFRSDMGGAGGELGAREGMMEDLKDQIKLALDEAVKLRIETSALQSRLGIHVRRLD